VGGSGATWSCFEHNLDDSGGEIRRAGPGEDGDGKIQVIKVALNAHKKSHHQDALKKNSRREEMEE